MANTGVTGKVSDTDGNPLAGFLVVAFDVEFSDSDEPLAGAYTDNNGNYTITYSKWDYGIERQNDVRLRVYNAVFRLVYESHVYQDVKVATLNADPINIREADFKGYLVTNLTGSPTMLSRGNALKVSYDNKQAWEELTDEVMGASSYIHSAQLMIDLNVFTKFDPEIPEENTETKGKTLEKVILEANTSRNVATRLVISDFIGEPECASSNTVDKLKKYFKKNKPNSVEVRPFRRAYNKAMHAKFTAVDGKIVILNASPILQEYFDDVTHKIDEERRGTMSFPANQIKVPIHDVSFSVSGPSVEHLEQTFDILWRETGGTGVGVQPHQTPELSEAKTSLQIVRTLPGNLFKTDPWKVPQGELGILEAYLRAIGEAEDFIYFENQYFTEPLIPTALLLALRKKPKLQVILLLNNKVDIPRYGNIDWLFYEGLQTKLLKQFIKDAEFAKDRVGIFTRWTHEASTQRIIRNYVHSKVGIVDDKWATLGSANLDGVSLNVSQHILFYYSTNDLLEERAIEVNAVIYDGIEGEPQSDITKNLRRKLWKEHLGYDNVDHDDLKTPPGKGWITLWKTAADDKLKGLIASPPTATQANILEWTDENDQEKYLKKLVKNMVKNDLEYVESLFENDQEYLEKLFEKKPEYLKKLADNDLEYLKKLFENNPEYLKKLAGMKWWSKFNKDLTILEEVRDFDFKTGKWSK